MEIVVIWVSLILGVAAISLSGFSIWMGRISLRDSQVNFEKTANTLASINERSAGTEKVVGEHFDKLMSTVLSIVKTATIGKAELESKEKLMGILADALSSGNQVKVDQVIRAMESISKYGHE